MALQKKAILLFLFLFTFHFSDKARAQQAGIMQYDHGTRQYEFYDGSQWYNLGLGLPLGACTKEGVMDYDPLVIVSYKYCNGTNWIRIIGIPTLSPCSGKGKMNFNGSTYLVCNGLLWTNIKGPPAAS